MELHEYTDEQLKAEIRRRAAIKAKQTREASKREKYIYWDRYSFKDINASL